MRVLVAEDDAALRSVLERGLRENGYVVDAVPDGAAALRHLRTYDYDVAVVDWRMPQRTGIEVVAEARSLGDRTPILMLTARDAPSDRVAGLNGGADDYLVKPFDFSRARGTGPCAAAASPACDGPRTRMRRPAVRPRDPRSDRRRGDGRR